MHFAISVIAIFAVSFFFVFLAQKLRFPYVVGMIVSGMILGFPLMREVLIEPNTSLIMSIGDMGFLFIMFLAGLEVSLKELYKERVKSVYVAAFAAVVPFLLGFFVFYLMGFPLVTALCVGICMSITAEATKEWVLLELGKLKTRAGAIMTEAGIIDDIIGISLFILLGVFLAESFLMGEESLLLAGGILAFFLGVMFHKTFGKENTVSLERFILFFILPFFFVTMGLRMEMINLVFNPLLLVVVLVVATLGKIVGTMLSKPLVKLKTKQLYLIGWGMNSRGAVELAIAFIALKAGMIPTDLYSSIIVMALVTTLVFPFILSRMIKKEPKIMN